MKPPYNPLIFQPRPVIGHCALFIHNCHLSGAWASRSLIIPWKCALCLPFRPSQVLGPSASWRSRPGGARPRGGPERLPSVPQRPGGGPALRPDFCVICGYSGSWGSMQPKKDLGHHWIRPHCMAPIYKISNPLQMQANPGCIFLKIYKPKNLRLKGLKIWYQGFFEGNFFLGWQHQIFASPNIRFSFYIGCLYLESTLPA